MKGLGGKITSQGHGEGGTKYEYSLSKSENSVDSQITATVCMRKIITMLTPFLPLIILLFTPIIDLTPLLNIRPSSPSPIFNSPPTTTPDSHGGTINSITRRVTGEIPLDRTIFGIAPGRQPEVTTNGGHVSDEE